jgi:hypothetical protein
MGAVVGGGSVGVVVGSDVDVLVGGGAAVGVGGAPPDGERQAVRETVSSIKMMMFFCILSFPYRMSLRAAVTWRRGNLLMPKTFRFL